MNNVTTHTPKDTLVDVNKLGLSGDLYDTLWELFEVNNGSIVRYYPYNEYTGLSNQDQAVLNHLLTEKAGIVFPEVSADKPVDRFYSLLLEFSW